MRAVTPCKENLEKKASPCTLKVIFPKKSESRGVLPATAKTTQPKSVCPKVPVSHIQKASAAAPKCPQAAPKAENAADNRGILRRSYSLCTFACRKVKAMFTGDKCADSNARWLWTKERKHGDNCQVYEVFKNSTISSHPTQFDNPSASRIIFIILPTGIIMPFETVNDSKSSKCRS